jgi:uncharacterized protein DUF6884
MRDCADACLVDEYPLPSDCRAPMDTGITMALYVVPCGKAKIWDKEPWRGATPARAAYTGSFACATRAYAESTGARWIVLSAKYGFLWPDELVPGPYNVTFSRPSTEAISIQALRQQVRDRGLDRFGDIVAIVGSAYAKRLRSVFENTNVSIRTPLANRGGMAKIVQFLKRACSEGRML